MHTTIIRFPDSGNLGRRLLRIWPLLALPLLLIATPLQAQQESTLEALYDKVLEDPNDLDALFAYSQEAIRVGDFEAAISALEGMLVISRRQPRVLFELGTLYQRLGAHRVAESYFARARVLVAEEEGVPAYMEAYLIESREETSKNSFRGIVQAGIRYQENPLNSPESSAILSGGSLVPLPDRRKVDSDTNLYVFSRMSHKYAINDATEFKTNILAYITKYNEQDQLDYSVLEVDSGPEFLFESTGDKLRLRPHLMVRESALDGDGLESTWGAGVDGAYAVDTNTTVKARLQVRDRDYDSDTPGSATPLRSGDETRFRLSWISEVKRGHTVSLGFRLRDAEGEVGQTSFDQLSLFGRYSIRFQNPFFSDAGKETLSFYLSVKDTEYDGPDPRIHPTTVREDDEWRLGVATVIPVNSKLGIHVKAETSERDSNLVNFDSDNNLFSIALRLSF